MQALEPPILGDEVVWNAGNAVAAPRLLSTRPTQVVSTWVEESCCVLSRRRFQRGASSSYQHACGLGWGLLKAKNRRSCSPQRSTHQPEAAASRSNLQEFALMWGIQKLIAALRFSTTFRPAHLSPLVGKRWGGCRWP